MAGYIYKKIKIKIVYFIPQLLIGGTERHLYDLVTHLDKELFECVVWCPGPWGPIGNELLQAGIKIIRFKFPYRIFFFHRFLKPIYYLKSKRFQIFHSYGYGPHYIDTIIAKLSGIPIYISSRRNIRHWSGGEKLHLGERIRNHFSDLVIANSEAVKKKSIEIEKIEPEKIKVIYNGVDFTKINLSSEKSQYKKGLGIPEDYTVIGNLANLKPVKGQKLLIEAFAKIFKKVNKVKLVISGEGPEKENLLKLADNLNIKDSITIVNSYLNRFELLNLFDIFVFPSLAEGFPNAIIEAMVMGKPVIASNVGGIPEAVIDGETGFLFETESDLINKLNVLISDEVIREKMGMNGRERAQRVFSLNEKIKEYEELYENLLHRKRNRVTI